MKKLLLIAALTSGSAMAHQDCSINLDGDIRIHKNELTITLDNDQVLFMDGKEVYLNQHELSLSQKQQALAEGYYTQMMGVAPEAISIALDAVDLASEAITYTFAELTGEDSDVVEEISAEFSDFSSLLKTKFYDDEGNIDFNLSDESTSDFFEQDFEEEFSARIESIVERSMGSLMMAIGSEMLFSGGSDAFEQKMEKFGENLETRIESQAEVLELRANQLCQVLKLVDSYETQLSDSVPELNNLDVIQLDKH